MDDAHLVKAWLDAAQDLAIEVVAPFTLKSRNGQEFNFIALVKNFGSEQGTLVTTNEHEEKSPEAAEEEGYYWSALYPESYSSYIRNEFIDVLNDWGWFGSDDKVPLWYTGKSWS